MSDKTQMNTDSNWPGDSQQHRLAQIYDVIIIGGGPAGLTAGIYAARAKLRTILLESPVISTQAALTDRIENYPGFPEGINGCEFVEKLKAQGCKFGLESYCEDVKSIEPVKLKDLEGWGISTKDKKYDSLSVIIATGAKPKTLDVPGEEKLRGKGVSYCAVCDGPLYKNNDIVVIGGGDAAVEEALFLTKFAKRVVLIHRRDQLRAAKVLQDQAFANKKMEFVWNSVVTNILGEKNVEAVTVKNLKTNEEKSLTCAGVFIFVGFIPNTDFLKEVVNLTEDGCVIADDNMRTSKAGIFAAGDCRQKLLHQVVTACGDGATAAISARDYVEALKLKK